MTHSVRYRPSALRAAALCVALLAASPAALAQTAPAATTTVQGTSGQGSGEQKLQTTRGVNVAIVALGSLWILLMIRRVQSVAALRHAEVGH